MSYPRSGWFLNVEVEIYRVVGKLQWECSRSNQYEIERVDLYQKKFGSTDGLVDIIHRLG